MVFGRSVSNLAEDQRASGSLRVDIFNEIERCGPWPKESKGVNMVIKRRDLIWKAPVALAFLAGTSRRSQGQLLPFRIFIQREERWPDVVGLSSCILGKLYVVQSFPTTVGVPTEQSLGSTLELPWRNNQNDISRIPAGSYKGSTREDGPKGWRIQLRDSDPRKLVQIHIGNYPKNTDGCILLGSGRSSTDGCMITGSDAALKALRDRYDNSSRPIEILIRDA